MSFTVWLTENWFLMVAFAAGVCVAGLAVYRFFGMPTEKQVDKIKEWLIWACIEAEKKLQSDTGQLKLRDVYNLFCTVPAFTWVAKVISFDLFSDWVSDALITVKQILVNNRTLASYVYGDNADVEIKKIKEQLEKSH